MSHTWVSMETRRRYPGTQTWVFWKSSVGCAISSVWSSYLEETPVSVNPDQDLSTQMRQGRPGIVFNYGVGVQ